MKNKCVPDGVNGINGGQQQNAKMKKLGR